jgi:ketosteroid isomerase-like protein
MKTNNKEAHDEPNQTVSDLVRSCFAAYMAKDRPALAALLSEDFRFHSPHDPDIDKTIYFEKCWPFSESVKAFHIEKLFAEGDEAFVRYECETKDGAKFRNTEFFRVAGNKIKEVEVYYGSLPQGLLAE